AQVVRRDGVGFDEMLQTHLGGIEFEFFCELVEMDFQSETWLRRAVPAFGAARRLVREGAQAPKAITRHFISDGLERTRVERRGDAIRAVSAAVEERVEVHRGDRAVFR